MRPRLEFIQLVMIFQDYFVLVPKEYFEPLILKEDIYDSCLAGATLPYCMQYGYPDIAQNPTALSEQHSQRPGGSLGDVYWFDRQACSFIVQLSNKNGLIDEF